MKISQVALEQDKSNQAPGKYLCIPAKSERKI